MHIVNVLQFTNFWQNYFAPFLLKRQQQKKLNNTLKKKEMNEYHIHVLKY